MPAFVGSFIASLVRSWLQAPSLPCEGARRRLLPSSSGNSAVDALVLVLSTRGCVHRHRAAAMIAVASGVRGAISGTVVPRVVYGGLQEKLGEEASEKQGASGAG